MAEEILVGETGFEPATPCTPCKCATRLRYTPKPDAPLYVEEKIMQEQKENLWLAADWPLRDVVLAGVSLSAHPHKPQGFNLALHVDDDADAVRARRAQLLAALPSRATPMWLSQVHGDGIVEDSDYAGGVEADASISRSPLWMAIVMTADCLPILLSTANGEVVAAIHAGWPGLYQGIIGKTVARMQQAPKTLYAWIGPGISAPHYEVDDGFYQRFIALDKHNARFFRANRPHHYLADLPALARAQLQVAVVPDTHIFASDLCSHADSRFFSHRRDKALAGRMASFIVKHPG